MESKGQLTADFINVVVWGRQAENCANYLKGYSLQFQEDFNQVYEGKDGIRRYVTEVVVARLDFRMGNREDSSFGSQFGSGDADFPGIDGFEPLDGDDNIPF